MAVTSEPRAETAPRRRRLLWVGPRSISLSVTLAVGIGALVLVAVAATLIVAMLASTKNTITLLEDRADLVLDLAEFRLRDHVDGVGAGLARLAQEIESGQVDSGDLGELSDALRAGMAITPQVFVLGMWRTDFLGTVAVRQGDQIYISEDEEPSDTELMQEAFDEARNHVNGYWGEIVYIPELTATIVNRRQPIYLDDDFAGLLVAGVSVRELSQLMARMVADNSEFGSAVPFIIYGDDEVLAHPDLARDPSTGDDADTLTGVSEEQPLLTVRQIGDPVLTALLDGVAVGSPMPELFEAGTFDFSFVEIEDDEDYLVLTRELSGYGTGRLTVGTYFSADVLNSEIGRLIGSAAIGIVIMLIAVVLGIWMGKRIARPVIRLADRASSVSETMEFRDLEPLPGSVFTELDRQARAFNSMTTGLRWLETYLPRTLVRRLVRKGLHDEVISISRPLTVMFTDIESFTAQSEGMPADQVASFLNEHFGMLGGCIEAEGGTIDKFIGDALMAFWSAPERQKDHADRACRAALAIRACIEADNAKRVARGDKPVKVRIGIHSGDVVVGNIGAPGRVNYTIVGDAVNTGNRLEALGKEVTPDPSGVTILISSDTAGLLTPGSFDVVDVGQHPIRGRVGSIDVMRLEGSSANGDSSKTEA
ncbi:MAG: adenylate/guanylate cyclase domain-containing protein [Pseudomonadota bacterium]